MTYEARIKPVEPYPPTSVRVIQVIEVIARRGNGVETCHRAVTQYWDFEGNLLAEHDPIADEAE